jgi:ribosomal protein L37AE/L43A
LNDGFLL